jgi:uncharacterized SAM-binding protein YcdF (DUF218 family)
MNESKKIFLRLLKIITIAFVLWLITFLVFLIMLQSNEKRVKTGEIDFAVVLGAGLNGSIPSQILTERLDSALAFKKVNSKVKIIVSGGRGPGEDITEADAMKQYLIKNGINDNDILTESKSTSTFENFKYSKALIDKVKNGSRSKIAIVTSDFHMLRAKFISDRIGIEIYEVKSNTPVHLYLPMAFREYFAMIKSIIIDKL